MTRGWHRLQIERARISSSNTEVSSGPDVESAEFVHQEHLRAPWADSPDGTERVHNLGIAHSTESTECQTSIDATGGEIENGEHLGSRQSRFAQHNGIESCDGIGREVPINCCAHP